MKYGDTVLSEDSVPRYFSGAIELTVEAPEGYEIWYREDQTPAEGSNSAEVIGTRVKNGKAIITDSGNSGKVYFKLAKTFTVNGREYRKLSHNYAVVHLTKLIGLPTPEVTVTPKNGGAPLTPSGPNTYTIKDFVNVALAKPSGWPLNATMAYAYNSSTSPQNAVPYTVPFEVRGEKTISVFTRVPKAGGGYDYKREDYAFKLDSSVKHVLLIVRNATAYDSNGKMLVTDSNGVNASVNVQVGARIKVVPNAPSGKIFKSWSANGIYDTPSDKFKEELFFTMPDRSNNYNMLSLWAEFADQSEAYITGDTKVLLVMGRRCITATMCSCKARWATALTSSSTRARASITTPCAPSPTSGGRGRASARSTTPCPHGRPLIRARPTPSRSPSPPTRARSLPITRACNSASTAASSR